PHPTRPIAEPEPNVGTSEFVSPEAEDRTINVNTPEGETTVVIQGLRSRRSLIAMDKADPGMSSPGLMEECDDAIMEELKDIISTDLIKHVEEDEDPDELDDWHDWLEAHATSAKP